MQKRTIKVLVFGLLILIVGSVFIKFGSDAYTQQRLAQIQKEYIINGRIQILSENLRKAEQKLWDLPMTLRLYESNFNSMQKKITDFENRVIALEEILYKHNGVKAGTF